MFWAVLVICWTAGLILAASEMFGRLVDQLRKFPFKQDWRESTSQQETAVVPSHNPPVAP